MRKSLAIICLILAGYSCSHKDNHNISHIENISSTSVDTMFLMNGNITPDYKYQVYSSKSDFHYDRLLSFLNDSTLAISTVNDQNKIDCSNKKSIDPLGMPTKWTEVIKLKGDYYLNLPSDRCNRDQKLIIGSCMLQWTCEGPMPRAIQQIERVNENHYILTLSDNEKEVSITIVDQIKGLAIWNSGNESKLFAFLKESHTLPVAVADCGGNKCPDNLKSDPIDFEKLLQNMK